MKVVVFDTGVLITLSMNSLLDILRQLKKNSNVRFVITKDVEHEAVKRPMEIKRFKLGAIQIKSLIDDGTLEFPEAFGIQKNEIDKVTDKILDYTNSMFYQYDKPIHIIDLGEASILALSKLLKEKGIENIIAIDERTARILCEKPENLQELLERKLHAKIKKTKQDIKFLEGNFFIRSTELIYVAYKKGIIKGGKDILDAMLYGAKFKGVAISEDEIRQIEKLA